MTRNSINPQIKYPSIIPTARKNKAKPITLFINKITAHTDFNKIPISVTRRNPPKAGGFLMTYAGTQWTKSILIVPEKSLSQYMRLYEFL